MLPKVYTQPKDTKLKNITHMENTVVTVAHGLNAAGKHIHLVCLTQTVLC